MVTDGMRVAVAGLGSVGMRVAAALDAGEMPGLRLTAVSAQTLRAGDKRMSRFGSSVVAVEAQRLIDHGDVVVECLPPSAFAEVAEPVVRRRGAVLVAVSVGALLERADLVETAHSNGARILAPSGAVAGLDALRAAALAGLKRVRLVTRKPPASFGESLLVGGQTVAANTLEEACVVFTGSARDAVRAFPKNVNVAATVSLAGLGPDRTEVEIRADPDCTKNTHELTIWSDAGMVTAVSANAPDDVNPKSSAITAYSVLACLRRLSEPFSIGS